ncbi:MAG: hypothetical protein IPK97_18810 [Ahniella sp.]|nr:hypothetical protein [Ahniella sp.]
MLASACCVLFFFLVASGTYLYLFLDTSVVGAFESIDQLSRESPWTGGLLRSMHRYAADGFLVLTWLHLLREMMLGRFRRYQSYSWWTGLPLARVGVRRGDRRILAELGSAWAVCRRGVSRMARHPAVPDRAVRAKFPGCRVCQ